VQIAPLEERIAKTGDAQLAFADGFPFMVVSQATLDHLNEQPELAGKPVPMARFRPSFVLSGCQPHGEDNISMMIADGIGFFGQKLCDRCSVPSFDQTTGVIDSRPLQALSRYRRWPSVEGEKPKIWVGRNFVHRGIGQLREGAPVECAI
jgi:uncharacterized protein YcbX